MKTPRTPLARLRAICLALPEATEVEAWGEPTFRVRNKLFAMHSSGDTHHGNGRDGVWIASTHVTQRFRARHPRVTIRLQSMTSRQIALGLTNGELDAGLTYLDNEPLPGVDALPLWREQLLLVVDAEGPFHDADEITWRTAATLPLCLLTPDMQHRRIVDAAFAESGARPNPAVETNSVSTLVAHARSGLPGVTAPTWLAANPLPPGLRALPLVDPEVRFTIGLVTASGGQRAPIVAELLGLFSPLELDQRIRRPISAVP